MTIKWLLLAGLAATLAACASVGRPRVATVEEPLTEGEAIAAQLGYHAPARPATQRMGGAPAAP
jgi:hypothetical protein